MCQCSFGPRRSRQRLTTICYNQVVDPSNVLYLACPDRVITQVRESQLIEDNGLASGLVKFIDNGVLLPGTDRPNARSAHPSLLLEDIPLTLL